MKWIKYSDQMPAEKQSFLGYGQRFSDSCGDEDEYSKRYVIEICYARKNENENKYPYEWNCCGTNYLINVSHWMPLPEEPQELE